MKYFSVVLGLITLFLLSCATPSEPEIEEEQEKLTYETIKNTTGYVYDLDFSGDYIYSAEDQAGFSIYDLDGNQVDAYFVNNISARTVHVSPTDSLIFLYNRTGSPGGITVFHQSTMLEEVVFNVFGNTSSLKDIFTLNSESLKVFWSGGTAISSSFFNEDLGVWESGSAIDFPTPVNKLDTNDGILYVSGSQLGIFVTDYETEEILQTINTPGVAMDVKYVDNTLFVACKEEGFVVIDITDLDNPVTTVNKPTEGWAQSVAVEDSILAIGSGGGGVYVYDISDITNPEFIGRIYASDIGYTYVVKIADGEIFAGTKVGIFKITINN